MTLRLPDQRPTSFEWAIFKWIFFPLIVFALLAMLIGVSKNNYKCKRVCEKKGFYDYRYTPKGQYGIRGNTCHCFTEVESKIKNKIPKGIRVF